MVMLFYAMCPILLLAFIVETGKNVRFVNKCNLKSFNYAYIFIIDY